MKFDCTASSWLYIKSLFLFGIIITIFGVAHVGLCVYVISLTNFSFLFDYIIGLVCVSTGTLACQLARMHRNTIHEDFSQYRTRVLFGLGSKALMTVVVIVVIITFFDSTYTAVSSIQACANSVSTASASNCRLFGLYECYGNSKYYQAATSCLVSPPYQCGCVSTSDSCHQYASISAGCGALVGSVFQAYNAINSLAKCCLISTILLLCHLALLLFASICESIRRRRAAASSNDFVVRKI
jgi:hypothetical protein